MVNKKNLIITLQKIGFSIKEAMIYVELIELNEALPSAIARKTGFSRTTIYRILQDFEKRGLASHIKKESSIYFQAQNPKRFLEIELERHQEQEKHLIQLEDSLPELLNLHSKYTSTPQMSVFRGKAGLIQVMEDTLSSSEELLCWSDIDLATNGVLKDYCPEYLQKRIENKIKLKGIFSYDKWGLSLKKRGEVELREVYLIAKDEFPFKNEINIYEDKVAIVSHEDKTGVIIQNKNIAETQKAIFNFAFKHAKANKRELLAEEDLEFLR